MKTGGDGHPSNEAGSIHLKDEGQPPLSLEDSTNNDDDNNSQTVSAELEDKRRDDPSVRRLEDNGNGDSQDDADGGKIFVPRKYDVLFGRGRPLQDHPGNLRFHRIVNRARSSYLSSRKEAKAGIAREVLYEIKTSKKNSEGRAPPSSNGDGGGDEVNSPSSGGEPGRFLKKVHDSNASGKEVYWIEVSDDVAVEKISHALRGRPRSETSNRSDGSSGSKGNRSSGAEKGQIGVASGRSYENKPSGGNSKRKGPPSPPTNETSADKNVAGDNTGVDLRNDSGEGNALQLSDVPDSILTQSVETPSRITMPSNSVESNSAQPLFNAVDSQLNTFIASLQLQQYQAALQFQHQNSQQIAQLQLLQQIMQLQQTSAQGVGASATANAFGQNQQPQLSTGVPGQLLAQQQQLQLTSPLQQHQVQQLLQQQQQQPQLHQQLQYILQQSQLPPAQQQPQNPSATTPSQQTFQLQQNPSATLPTAGIGNVIATPTTVGGTATDTNSLVWAYAILSGMQQNTGNSGVNPTVNTQNILSTTSSSLGAQQPQGAPNPIAPNPQLTDPQTMLLIQQQLQQQQQQQIQQQLQQILQQSQALLGASLNPPLSNVNSSLSTKPPDSGNPPPPNNHQE